MSITQATQWMRHGCCPQCGERLFQESEDDFIGRESVEPLALTSSAVYHSTCLRKREGVELDANTPPLSKATPKPKAKAKAAA